MTDSATFTVNFDALRDALQAAGYRVEAITNANSETVSMRSSTGGLAFDVYPGNRLPADAGFADVAFAAAVQTQQGLSLDIPNRWNATRRFGRLSFAQAGDATFLMLNMDVLVTGVVTPNYLRHHIEIWDALAQDLVAFLRDELRRTAVGVGAEASRRSGDAMREYHAVAS